MNFAIFELTEVFIAIGEGIGAKTFERGTRWQRKDHSQSSKKHGDIQARNGGGKFSHR